MPRADIDPPGTSGYITDQSVSTNFTTAFMPAIKTRHAPAPPAPAIAPSRQRRKEARPQELLDAALELFGEKGFAATRTDDVAERAGVSKGTLYLYYPSKEELLKAVISQRLSSEIAAGAAQADTFEGSTAQLLTEVLTTWWQGVFDSPTSAVFKIVITEVRNFPEIGEFYEREVAQPGKQLIGRMIERGIARGEFRSVDVPSVVLSLVLPMVMLCLHKHSLAACVPLATTVDPNLFIARHVELVLHGLLIQPTPGRRSAR